MERSTHTPPSRINPFQPIPPIENIVNKLPVNKREKIRFAVYRSANMKRTAATKRRLKQLKYERRATKIKEQWRCNNSES